MSQDKGLAIAGLVIGALAGGVPGAILGGLIGSAVQEYASLICPNCKNTMQCDKRPEGDYYRCNKCGYTTYKTKQANIK